MCRNTLAARADGNALRSKKAQSAYLCPCAVKALQMNCRAVTTAIAGCLLTIGAGCGASGYTELSTRGSECGVPGGRVLVVGDRVSPVLRVRNTSGTNWKTTFVWVKGVDDFRIDSTSLNDEAGAVDGDKLRLGPIAAGATGVVRIQMTASEVGAPTVGFYPWGSADAAADAIYPGAGPGGKCDYSIRS